MSPRPDGFVNPPARSRAARPDEFTARAHGRPDWTLDVREPAMLDAWLSSLGPTSAVLWQYLARQMGEGVEVFTIAGLAEYTGTMPYNVWRALDRLVRFGRLTWVAGDVLSVEVCSCPPRKREKVTT